MSTSVLWLAVIEIAVTGGTWLHSKATRTPWLGCWFLWHLAAPVAIATALALWLAAASNRCAGRAVRRWRISDGSAIRPNTVPDAPDLRTFVEHGS